METQTLKQQEIAARQQWSKKTACSETAKLQSTHPCPVLVVFATQVEISIKLHGNLHHVILYVKQFLQQLEQEIIDLVPLLLCTHTC